MRRIYTDGTSRFRPIPSTVILNWGCSQGLTFSLAALPEEQVLNQPLFVAAATNKLISFQALLRDEAINIPDFTADKDVANEWLTRGAKVVCRHVLNGHSGSGIEIVDTVGALPDVPLYVQYVKKKAEYRVHVAFGKVIDVQQKKRRRDFDGNPDPMVRNHSNGWVYCREDLTPPTDLEGQALAAIAALNLDYGAVDIIYNQHYNKCFVLEVNTAPGLEGTTLEKYTDAFMEKLHG